MPRKKLIRRFEPRFGVSREMVEVEARYVGREVEDFELGSPNELRENLDKLRRAWKQADEMLERHVCHLPVLRKLAVQCVIVRDLYHLLELYSAYLKAPEPDPSDTKSTKVEVVKQCEPNPATELKSVPFSEWLFNPEDR